VQKTDYKPIVAAALAEDLADAGDVTSDATIPADVQAQGDLVVRQAGVVAGLDVAAHVFQVVDAAIEFRSAAADGDRTGIDSVVGTVSGPASSILTAERTALNLLARMSGVATATAELVAAVDGTGARISDTRKTMPGLRVLDKYAVTAGGGVNHRMGLYDAVMIKDNHLVAGLGIVDAVSAARQKVGSSFQITVEVENLDQVRTVLVTDADRVLLDNMNLEMLREAVEIVGGKVVTEASGGITLDNVREIAETGVDVISVGWITHSAPQLDIALDFRSDR
jgi:nicotinate-nucleotide pyrophosphorylase (carboxylating)